MSDDKSHKGISLRRKKTTRPTISAPRQISAPREAAATPEASRNPSVWTNDSNHSGLSARPREARPSLQGRDTNTSDLVKRRYSTRFTGSVPTQDGMAPPVPAMPAMPAQYASAMSRSPPKNRSPERMGGGGGGAGRLKVDDRALRDPNLQAEKYVQSILADASENDIQNYQDELHNLKLHTSTDLQHNVYQNRTQFIKIAKEADKLKSEMRTLRTLMNELTGALGHATSAAGAEALTPNSNMSLADRKRANRSSVANLEAMWSTHLQTLWKRIEGSQKFLPALPGRHIIMESQRWVELNAATWKPRRRVALVLLNDHLLIASEKKVPIQTTPQKNNPATAFNNSGPSQQTTLVAERCWPLQDVSLADISSRNSAAASQNSTQTKAIQNAVNIRAGNESFTYAISDSAEKAGLLVAFRKGQEDLRKQIAAEHGERERQLDELALLTGRDPRALKKAAAAAAASDADDPKSGGLTRSNSVLVDVDGRQQSIRWVESQIDSLDIDIALQHFEASVARVEKLRKLARSIKGNAAAQDIILTKIDERAAKLGSSIGRQLVQTSSGTERTKENVSWLLRLGYEEMARTRYLESRTQTIDLRTRQLPFTGALPPYLHALSYTTFTLLLHTFRTFSGSFPAASGSAVVKWAKERVDEFNVQLERQLSSVERGCELWRECVDAVREQAGVLGEVAVDFSGLVARGLEGGGGAGGAGAGVVSPKGVGSPMAGEKSGKGPVGLGLST